MTPRFFGERGARPWSKSSPEDSSAHDETPSSSLPEIESTQERYFAESLIIRAFTRHLDDPSESSHARWTRSEALNMLVERFGESATPLVLDLIERTQDNPENLFLLEGFFVNVTTDASSDLVLDALKKGTLNARQGFSAATQVENPNTDAIRELVLEEVHAAPTRVTEHSFSPSLSELNEMLRVLGHMQNPEATQIIVDIWNEVSMNKKLRKQYDEKFFTHLITLRSDILGTLQESQNTDAVESALKTFHGLTPQEHARVLRGMHPLYPPLDDEVRNTHHVIGSNATPPNSINNRELSPPPIVFSPFEAYLKEHGGEGEHGGHLHELITDFFESDLSAEDLLERISTAFEGSLDTPESRHTATSFLKLFGAISRALPDHEQVKRILDNIPEAQENDSTHSLIQNVREVLKKIPESAFALPPSAEPFTLYSKRLDRTRPITGFVEQLRKKVFSETTQYATNVLSGKLPTERAFQAIFERWTNVCFLYRDVDKYDIPLYEEAAYHLEHIPKDQEEVFYGRDADYLYFAIKAMRLGLVDAKKPKRININRAIVRGMQSDDALRDRVLMYLEQHRIGSDDLHIDTGYKGSVPEAIIRLLNPKLDEKQISERIKLLEADTKTKTRALAGGLTMPGGSVGGVEMRPKRENTAGDIQRGETGLLHVIADDTEETHDGEVDPLKAWVTQQAVTRHFLPRMEERTPRGLRKEQKAQTTDLELAPKDIDSLTEEARLRSPQEQTTRRERQLSGLVRKHIGPEEGHETLTEDLIRLYAVSRDIIGPVYGDFIQWIDQQVPDKNPVNPRRLVFLGRDGLAPYLVEQIFSNRGITDFSSTYLPISRHLFTTTPEEQMTQYLNYLVGGLGRSNTRVSFVDVGMYGATHKAIANLFPQASFESFFLISKSNEKNIHGYLHDPNQPESSLWEHVSGNPAVHFLEDTFSGSTKTVDHFSTTGPFALPEPSGAPYESAELLMRRAALMGIVDAAAGYDPDNNDTEINKKRLEAYFENEFKDDMNHIMVPHES